MSDPVDSATNFLRRWSKRKRAAEARAPDGAQAADRQPIEADTNPTSPAPAQREAAPPPFDPASLPPIDSITAASDIRAFLAPGVPQELARAALRRVWVTDPTIRDFIGIAENQWDFTNPDGVPGFGSLEFTPALRRMVADLFADAPEAAPPAPPPRRANAERLGEIAEKSTEPPPPALAPATGARTAGIEQSHPPRDFSAPNDAPVDRLQVIPQHSNDDAAVQNDIPEVDTGETPAQRKHGGAVPK